MTNRNTELMNKVFKYKGFIFDMDGTLLDSSSAIREVFTKWCRKHGFNTEKIMTLCHGARVVDHLPSFAPHLNIKEEVDYLIHQETITTEGGC